MYHPATRLPPRLMRSLEASQVGVQAVVPPRISASKWEAGAGSSLASANLHRSAANGCGPFGVVSAGKRKT